MPGEKVPECHSDLRPSKKEVPEWCSSLFCHRNTPGCKSLFYRYANCAFIKVYVIFFSVLSVPEISHYLHETHMLLKDYCTWLKILRGDQPGVVSKVYILLENIC
jgi:hypothetical protein